MEERNYLKLVLIKKDFLDKVQLKCTIKGDTYKRRTLRIYGTNIAASYVYNNLYFITQGYYVIVANSSTTDESEIQIDRTLVKPQIRIPKYTEHIRYGNIVRIPGVKFKSLIRSGEDKGTALISYGIGIYGIRTKRDTILKSTISNYKKMALHLLKRETKEYFVKDSNSEEQIIPKETIFSLQEFLEEKEIESPVIILKLDIYGD